MRGRSLRTLTRHVREQDDEMYTSSSADSSSSTRPSEVSQDAWDSRSPRYEDLYLPAKVMLVPFPLSCVCACVCACIGPPLHEVHLSPFVNLIAFPESLLKSSTC